MAKLTMDEMRAITKKALDAAEDVYDKDAVVQVMFANGVVFGKLQTLYKTVGIAENFMVDPAKVKEDVNAIFTEAADEIEDIEDWAALEEYADDVVEEVTGATQAMVIRLLRAYFKEFDLTFPKKTKGGTRVKGGKLAETVINYVNGVSDPKKIDMVGMFKALVPVVRQPSNAYDRVSLYFAIVYATLNGIGIKDAQVAMKKMVQLDPKKLPEVAVVTE